MSLSEISKLAIKTLGELIRTARTERGLSQSNLAQRLNVSRYSIIAIERGDPKGAIGAVFEAAFIVGIPLLADNNLELQKLERTLVHFRALLPKRVRIKNEPIDDNF
jgi:transcriptional regulator with XRE-family HTH domain